MFAFIKPCYLIRVILSLIIKKNQKHESDKVELVALQVHRSAVFRQPAAWLPWSYQTNLAPA